MTDKETSRVLAINASGRPKTLLKVQEDPNGNIYLFLNKGETFRDVSHMGGNVINERVGEKVYHHKFSIHNSDQSPTNINVLKHLFTSGPSRSDESVTFHFTRAIKTTNKFAPLFAQRFSDLAPERFDLDVESPNKVRLGALNQKTNALVMTVLVSNKSRKFELRPLRDINYLDLLFSNYRLTVLWAYLPIPAHSSGLFGHYLTFRDDEPDENLRALSAIVSDGFTESEIVELIRTKARWMVMDVAMSFNEGRPTDQTVKDFRSMAQLGLSKTGSMKSYKPKLNLHL